MILISIIVLTLYYDHGTYLDYNIIMYTGKRPKLELYVIVLV